MNRAQKTESITDLQGKFQQATVALVSSSQKLKVSTMQQLRRALKEVDGEYKVTKNTLTRLAVKDTDYSGIEDTLEGPTALVFGYSDPVGVAKVLVNFAKEHEEFSLKAGVLDAQVIAPDAIKELALLPSREELIGKLMGVLQAPASQLLRTIQEPGAQVARLLEQVRARSESSAQ